MWISTANACRFFVAISRNQHDPNVIGKFKCGQTVIHVRPKDWCAFREIMMDDEYGLIRRVLKDTHNPVVLDLGANIGLFSAQVFSVQPKAIVHSVEAGPNTFQMLERNRGMNPSLNWRVYHYAVCDREGDIAFEEGAFSTSGHIVSKGNGLKVPGITLDRLLNGIGQAVDLVKMDIEGAEEGVLCSSQHSLKLIKYLIVEIHPNISGVERTVSVLANHYKHIYAIPGRRSTKPLLLASNDDQPLPLFVR
jgi:FkbM family methyltransferase